MGVVSPKDQPPPPLQPQPQRGPSDVFLLYKNQVRVLPPLPSGSQTAPLFFRAADCESQSLKREAKYIPLVNEINLFKSLPGGSLTAERPGGRGAGWQAEVMVTAANASTCTHPGEHQSPGHGPGAKVPAQNRGQGGLCTLGPLQEWLRLCLPGQVATDTLPSGRASALEAACLLNHG